MNLESVEFLEDKEQLVLKYKLGKDLKILCTRHYKNEVLHFFDKSKRFQGQCCNILKLHKKMKPRKTKLVSISPDLAKESHIHLGLQVIPFSKICQDCIPVLEARIQSSKAAETIPSEETMPVIEEAIHDDLDYGETDIKEVILGNIKNKLEILDRVQLQTSCHHLLFYHQPGQLMRFQSNHVMFVLHQVLDFQQQRKLLSPRFN